MLQLYQYNLHHSCNISTVAKRVYYFQLNISHISFDMWFWLCSSCLLFFTREIERIYVWFQSAVDFSTKLVYSIFAFQQKNWTKNRQQDDTGHMGVFHYSYWKLSQNCYKILCFFFICDALHDLVPFVQFKTREKHPWRSVTFSKVAGWNYAKRKIIF